ncbi:hypothetical protein Rsub_10830 [Raphidocelis subcapitata]|uniref:Beta-fructofuranosidase n=1 Tax=Raphidocelis subcapitata TaxID=307507 RepID=A0A2V0PFP1_9CHLO|nr:hypothetical protein Rsub_10830 [Raphidocelis subcapitata]|eukprot:GBF98641.1 hypothetical protein Rsub_10830 [Raphidocelis subcapitata]
MAGLARRFCVLVPFAAALVLLLSLPSSHLATARVLTQYGASGPAPDLKAYVDAGCSNSSVLATWQPLRPGYHITAPWGWLNDPHGLFERQGLHHQFFQYNPRALAWGAPFWAHVVSEDLVRWRWLPPALAPDSRIDFNGVWSGAVTVTEDGTPWLSYTAAATFVPELGNFFQTQALASPVDPGDRLLRVWRKAAANPVLVQTPPGGNNFQFRDTTPANTDVRDAVAAALEARRRAAANANDTATAAATPAAPRFAWAVGAQAFCLGTAAIYTAPAIEGPYSFSGVLYNQLTSEPQLNGQCEAPGNASRAAVGGPCNQFGSRCRMWEVVDSAAVAPGVYMVKWSDQDRSRDPFSAEWYALSDELNAGALRLGSDGAFNAIDIQDTSAFDTLLSGRLGGRPFTPLRLDWGSSYASKFERLKDGRLILNTWVYETFEGCVDSCSDHKPAADDFVKRLGFKGVLQLPRTVTYSPETRSIRLFPINEVAKLRQEQVVNASATALPPASSPLVLLQEASTGTEAPAARGGAARQFHARLEFSVAPKPGAGALNFTVGARLLTGGGSRVDFTLSGTAGGALPAARDGELPLSWLRLDVDRSAAAGMTARASEGGAVPLPLPGADAAWVLPRQRLVLDLFVDHSLVEAYALQGLGRATTRIYPSADGTAWGLAVFGGASGPAAVRLERGEAWSMGNAFAGQDPLC